MKKSGERAQIIALAGNPNVGKSTVFNALTGLHQHTGNWPGKTVDLAQGAYLRCGKSYTLVDLPGTYSLTAHSAEEAVARDFIAGGEADCVVVVCDGACLERNLNLVLQILELTPNVIVCVNLLDEAERRGITVDLPRLSRILDLPVVGTAATGGEGLDRLAAEIARVTETPPQTQREQLAPEEKIRLAEKIAKVVLQTQKPETDGRDRRLDRLLTGRATGIPLMLLLLGAVFWLTIQGANYPSQLLAGGFFWVQDRLTEAFTYWGAPAWLHGALVLGVYRTLAWVVSVMLPPMAIFFPLFTLLEDFGYLPRVAFVLDHAFQKAHACGKQALTMCMGFGCNAAGVVGCRIIDSPRERLIAIITNNFVPCNGRFPTLIAIITMFFLGTAAGAGRGLVAAFLLTGVILLGVGMTFWVSRLLSRTILKGLPSSFTLELPPYRKPQLGRVITRSILDRTLFVLGRAVAVAAPAGLIIWVLANVQVGGLSMLGHCTAFLDPFARLLGLDGVILMAFILGFPANEIVLPLAVMGYLSTGSMADMGSLAAMRALLLANGWTGVTAVCTMLFSLLHWPCSTTCITIGKETGSVKWTLAAFLVPTVMGMAVCCLVATAGRLMGLC
ncbi:MAG: ferrous iron transporter B [Pseudoflavonifractor sp.]